MLSSFHKGGENKNWVPITVDPNMDTQNPYSGIKMGFIHKV